MRARVSLTTLKRIAALEQRRTSARVIALFPAILGWDEWEAQATDSQLKLCTDTRGNDHIETDITIVPGIAPETISQAEHERLYREHVRSQGDATKQFIKHKQAEIKRLTTR